MFNTAKERRKRRLEYESLDRAARDPVKTAQIALETEGWKRKWTRVCPAATQ